MKRGLNILCVLVVLVLSFSIFQYIQVLGGAFMDGFNAGLEQQDAIMGGEDMKHIAMIPVAVNPDKFGVYTDSVYNTMSGEYVPMHYSRILLELDTKPTAYQLFMQYLSGIAIIIAKIFAIFWFVKLIVCINKGTVFCWKNVSLLRKLGVALIIAFIFDLIASLLYAPAVSELFAMEGYRIAFLELISSVNLVLGLVSFIVAQVFALGLRMQEEQELTI